MRLSLLALLECPHCGQGLEIARRWPGTGDRLAQGLLGCPCAAFPVVDGIPILRLDDSSRAAIDALEHDDPTLARRHALGVEPAELEALDALGAPAVPGQGLARSLAVLLPATDATYFRLRFGDPTFTVARALAEGLLAWSATTGRPALDACGGCGHLAWVLSERSAALGLPPPVLAEGNFRLAWLASRFLATGAEVVCCDASQPLPFRRAAFGVVACVDAMHYIWNRRLLAGELLRAAGEEGTIVATHLHNAAAWTPSAGMPLTVDGYRHLFTGRQPRVRGDRALLEHIVRPEAIPLDAWVPDTDLSHETSLTIVAGVAPDALPPSPFAGAPIGTWALHPLYDRSAAGTDTVTLELRFPTSFYEEEFGALLRQYLPERLELPRRLVEAPAKLAAARPDLVRARVLLDVPSAVTP